MHYPAILEVSCTHAKTCKEHPRHNAQFANKACMFSLFELYSVSTSVLPMMTCLSCWGSWQSSSGCGSHCQCTQRDPGCGRCSSECSRAAASHSWSLALPWPAPGLQCTSRACHGTGGGYDKEGWVAFAIELHCLRVKGMSVAQQHGQGNVHP